MLKVLIVDDHPIVVNGVKALLAADGGIEPYAAACAAEAERCLAAQPIEVAIVDVNLPGLSGFELTRRLVGREPPVKVLMLSMNDDAVFVARAMEVGAKGYVSKNENPAHMLRALKAIAAGGTAWPAGISGRIALLPEAGAGQEQATGRDLEVLRLLIKGKSLQEIAELLGVSYKTIATTCAALRVKFGARTQAELIAIAVAAKIV